MPRSGSTLLCNLVAQHPDVFATGTSGSLELIYPARKNVGQLPEFKSFDLENIKRHFSAFAREGMRGWFESQTDCKVVVDKSRGWIGYLPLLFDIWPDAKVLVPVRDPRDAMASLEKAYRENMHIFHEAEDPSRMSFVTLESRVNHWMNNAPMGLAMARLHNLLSSFGTGRVHFVRFEDLTSRPGKTMDGVWDYIGMDRPAHDFDNVEQVTVDNDMSFGPLGSHRIRGQVRPLKSRWREVLGEQIGEQIKAYYAPFYQAVYPHLD